ncbi:hypothetical protein BpHYR1_039385 [Brachionus plicatilis]|uniref:Uncharacterized protein n=1 Tax=Brachionus plicatilis TaxID=10195 RepID=A0A3M7SUT3_BRAPC|nr:hypothetical protein BpHYR1_039385 [Brachionus plicatilis]
MITLLAHPSSVPEKEADEGIETVSIKAESHELRLPLSFESTLGSEFESELGVAESDTDEGDDDEMLVESLSSMVWAKNFKTSSNC